MNLERSHIQSQHIKVNLTSVFRQWTIGIWSFLKSKIYYQVKTYEAQAGLTEHVQGLYSESRQTIKHSKASEDCPRGTEDKNLPTSAGDMVWSLVQEDSACHGATKPVHQNYWAGTLKPVCCRYRNLCARSLTPEKPPQREACVPQLASSPCTPQLETFLTQQRSPSAAEKKKAVVNV